MGRHKPKKVPLTPEQEAAVHTLADDMLTSGLIYATELNGWHQGQVRKRPVPPADLDPQVARATEEWLDAIGLRAEEIVMEPFDAAEQVDVAA